MHAPIDVIFKHPVKRYTVIYHQGQLWQLPRLEVNTQAWQHKKPYTGSREHIFVASQQQIAHDNIALRAVLATIALPASVVGRHVDEFEAWWRAHGLDYQAQVNTAKQSQQQAAALLHASIHTPNNAQLMDSQGANDRHPVTATAPRPAATHEIAGDDVFEQMLFELKQHIVIK